MMKSSRYIRLWECAEAVLLCAALAAMCWLWCKFTPDQAGAECDLCAAEMEVAR